MRWKYDHGKTGDKDFEGGSLGPLEGAILAFTWTA
jgi:hypothetical protein